ncbi:MAG: carboxypeptidase M32, partial [Nitrospirales bacterium]|nr:carboxypeptidase M32 [Nitrospirales bacterium]
MNSSSFLDSLKSKLIEIHHLRDAAALLSWDQETYMPAGGGQARAEQIATLQTLAHDKFVSAEIEDLLSMWIDEATGHIQTHVQSELDDTSQALLRETWRDFSQAKKLPSSFVNRLQRECSLAQQVWAEARKNNDFKSFLPNLRTLLALKIEEAKYLGFVESPYDPLLDRYEPGATAAQLKPLFSQLRERLVSLLQQVLNSSHKPNEKLLTQAFETEKQLAFGRMVLEKMGYQFDRGRLDLSTHPFTTSFHPTDVRVTTRVFERDLSSCLFSCIH